MKPSETSPLPYSTLQRARRSLVGRATSSLRTFYFSTCCLNRPSTLVPTYIPPFHHNTCLDSARLGHRPRILRCLSFSRLHHQNTPPSLYCLAFLATSLSRIHPFVRILVFLALSLPSHSFYPSRSFYHPLNLSLFNSLHTKRPIDATRNQPCSDCDPEFAVVMSETGRVRASNARAPLADATQRINNASTRTPVKSSKSHDKAASHAQHVSTPGRHRRSDALDPSTPEPKVTSPSSVPSGSRNPAVARARASHEVDPLKRMSQASQTSTAPSSKRSSGYAYKTHIGPWLLGKTLGKGSSARVRLCKHRLSGELAAVKIVPKKTAYLIQAGSLAEIHDYDDSLPERINGEMRVPLSIEREVAILKLVDHPNVMKVYDIWENRSEMFVILVLRKEVAKLTV